MNQDHMDEERPKSFFSRMFAAPPEDDEDETTTYSRREIGTEEIEEPERAETNRSRSFTVERAADIIRELPPEVPRKSAVRIVRQTLIAAGISIEDLGRSTRARESKLNSEIKRREERKKDLQDNTNEVLRSLEEEMRKAREARDSGVAEEERRISEAREGLSDVEKVRDFFDVPRGESRSTPLGERRTEEETTETPEAPSGEETQVLRRSDIDDTQVLRPRGPLSESWDTDRDTEKRDW